MSLNRFARRRDRNEAGVLRSIGPLGGFWLPYGPFDGWLWDRSAWRLCEVKRPDKRGWKSEYTDAQLRLIATLEAREIPWQTLRTEADVLALMSCVP